MLQLQSQLFGAPQRTPPSQAEGVSHKFLTQGGFVHQLASGIFSLLPLGLRVHHRIEAIIRDEMNRLGAQEVLLPSLQPRALWEESGRWSTMDPPLFVVRDRHQRELTLGPTHEEVVTDLARTYLTSYKQLPVAVYQLQTKFRNEQRASGGLLRVREFLMKDLYSFHASPEDLVRYYEEVKQAYLRVFSRCGLRVIPVAAESGSIGGEVSHEFALIAETGEDTVAQCSQCAFAVKREHLGDAVGQCPECGAQLTDLPCIENGHIFQLGIRYSQALNARVAAADGSKKFLVMGCYGIGVGRLLASIVEAAHDDTGIRWPSAVSPYDVHVLSLRGGSAAHTLAASLRDEGFDVLYDDREEATAGEKFADSELIGIPAQVIVSERGIRERSLEVRPRSDRRRTVRVAYDHLADIVRAIRGILESAHV